MKYLLALLILVSTPVLACETLESCMDACKYHQGNPGARTGIGEEESISVCGQGIVFKLDEISKTLDKQLEATYERETPHRGVGWNPVTKTYDAKSYIPTSDKYGVER